MRHLLLRALYHGSETMEMTGAQTRTLTTRTQTTTGPVGVTPRSLRPFFLVPWRRPDRSPRLEESRHLEAQHL